MSKQKKGKQDKNAEKQREAAASSSSGKDHNDASATEPMSSKEFEK